MFKLIILVLLNILGYNQTPQPVRLGKKRSMNKKIRLWIKRHEHELLFLCVILAMILFVLAVFVFVPAMDPYNNHFHEVV